MMKPRTILGAVFGLFLCALLLSSCMTNAMTNRTHKPQGQFAEIDGVKVHYVDLKPQTDTGLTPIIMIHGASANLLDMKLALGDRLSKTRRVILVDRAGHGYSGRPRDGYLLTVQTKLINGLIHELGIEKPIVLGQSFGGVTSLTYALQYPDDLSALVLIAPVSHEWPGDVDGYHAVSANPVFGPIFRRTLIPLYAKLKGKAVIDGAFWPLMPPEDYYDKSGMALLFRPAAFKADSFDRLHLLEQIKQQQSRYSEIIVPTRIITGTHDTSVSPGLHSMALDREMPNAELLLLTGIGHPLHHVAQDEIEGEIAELDRILSLAP